MTDLISWIPETLRTPFGVRVVYVKHFIVPFESKPMMAANSAFSVPAYTMMRRKRIRGFVSSDEEGTTFVPYTNQPDDERTALVAAAKALLDSR